MKVVAKPMKNPITHSVLLNEALSYCLLAIGLFDDP